MAQVRSVNGLCGILKFSEILGSTAYYNQQLQKNSPLSQILERKHNITEAYSGETAHLKKLPMENICVSVAYISVTNLSY